MAWAKPHVADAEASADEDKAAKLARGCAKPHKLVGVMRKTLDTDGLEEPAGREPGTARVSIDVEAVGVGPGGHAPPPPPSPPPSERS